MGADKKPPIKVGDIFKLGVVRFGWGGNPIMLYKGFVIFLRGIEKRGVQLNVMVEIRITKVLSNFAFAERVN